MKARDLKPGHDYAGLTGTRWRVVGHSAGRSGFVDCRLVYSDGTADESIDQLSTRGLRHPWQEQPTPAGPDAPAVTVHDLDRLFAFQDAVAEYVEACIAGASALWTQADDYAGSIDTRVAAAGALEGAWLGLFSREDESRIRERQRKMRDARRGSTWVGDPDQDDPA